MILRASVLWLTLVAAMPAAAQAPSMAPPVVAPPVPADPIFTTCMSSLRSAAEKQGITTASFDTYTNDLAADMSVLDLLDAQPEFTTPLWDYLAALVDDQRVADGQAMLATHAELLGRVSQAYGVDPATVVAVWGVESDYGRVFGKRPLLVSLSTLSCFGRRQAFFRGEFLTTLKLLQAGDVRVDGLNGSWAGAFGHTQFMPSTHERIAVDFDGDGRRNLIDSIPDALASTANYLVKSGWRTGEPWGYEVTLPVGFDLAQAGRTNRKPLTQWVAQGIARIDGQPLPVDDRNAAVLVPTGVAGPAFVVFKNYDAIYSYNAAESYALAIALLADRLRGGSGLVARWPTDDPGIGRPQRRELQTLLLARGHAIGAVDGMIGTQTRRAIVIEQQRLGLQPADGRAGTKILAALKAAGPPVALPETSPP
nr:lytic murein transglycosylase [uncultured Pseudoxanthomonas sp.]